MSGVPNPGYKGPKGRPQWTGAEGLEALKHHLQTAVLLELYTIPLYLYADYSMIDDPDAHKKFQLIVRQEMLHLGLAGNILTAVGGTPRLYGKDFTPEYPADMFYQDRVKAQLKAGTPDNIQTFVDLEAPDVKHVMMGMEANALADYRSIGDFYESTIFGLAALDADFKARGQNLFDLTTSGKQFQQSDDSWRSPDMAVIWDVETAVKAMTLIVEQGEGGIGAQIAGITSHYELFSELHAKKIKCYPVVSNPITEEFKSHTKVYKMMLASDAAYAYLLLTLEKMWTYEGPLRAEVVAHNMRNLMSHVIAPMALFLVKQKISDTEHAAAPFNLYEFTGSGGKTPFQEMQAMIREALAEFPGEADLKEVEHALNGLVDINRLSDPVCASWLSLTASVAWNSVHRSFRWCRTMIREAFRLVLERTGLTARSS